MSVLASIQPDSSTGFDTYINEGSPTTNYGSSDRMVNSGTYDVRFLLKFDLTSLDTGTYYGNANLKLKAVAGDYPGSATWVAYSILSGNSGWTENGATWNTIDGVTSWAGSAGCATAGVDYSSSQIGSGTAQTIGTTTILIYGSTINDWVQNPSNNNGLIILTTTAYTANIASCEYVTSTFRPELEILSPENVSRRTLFGLGTRSGSRSGRQ